MVNRSSDSQSKLSRLVSTNAPLFHPEYRINFGMEFIICNFDCLQGILESSIYIPWFRLDVRSSNAFYLSRMAPAIFSLWLLRIRTISLTSSLMQLTAGLNAPPTKSAQRRFCRRFTCMIIFADKPFSLQKEKKYVNNVVKGFVFRIRVQINN